MVFRLITLLSRQPSIKISHKTFIFIHLSKPYIDGKGMSKNSLMHDASFLRDMRESGDGEWITSMLLTDTRCYRNMTSICIWPIEHNTNNIPKTPAFIFI